MCVYTHIYTGWPRPIECLIFVGHFSQKKPKIRSSFAENDLQLKACYGSWPPCPMASVPSPCVKEGHLL